MSEPSPEPAKDSPADSATPTKPIAPKNKQCPFCGDSFTSSSLGRHLDLYIKEKNPKAADGVHDVEKIRQIRSNITRRHARKSTQRTSVSTPGSNGPFAPGATGVVIGTDENKRYVINRPTWEATGVMTDIGSSGLQLDLGPKRSLSRSDAAIRKRMIEDRTRLRAAELALQEVLDSVNAASATAHPASPFNFDFLSQTFPALCLRMLPKQPTLCAVQVVENTKCCPINPPTKAHYELLKQNLNQKLSDFSQIPAQARQWRDVHDPLSQNGEAQTPSSRLIDPSVYKTHLNGAFDVWKGTPDAQKASLWRLETLRAYNAAHDETASLRDQLSKAETQMAHLRLQIARLSECQQPKEYTFNIPAHHEISVPTVKGLAESKVELPLDREDLIKKWVEVVKENGKYQRALPELELSDLTVPSYLMEVEQEGMDGAADSAQPDDGEGSAAGDGDSADAAGEDDDEVVTPHVNGINGITARGAPSTATGSAPLKVGSTALDRSMLDPGLRNEDDEEAMEVDRGDFGGEMLLANLKAREKAGQ